jgi:phosphoribosylformylglycinamidine synthase I
MTKAMVKPAIVVFPGSNCDRDMVHALKMAFDLEPVILWHMEEEIPKGVTHVILPGGFSFGDYLRAGALAALSPIMDAIKKFAALGGMVLGVCNGFQILCESGLLPGVLLPNHHDRFVCRLEKVTWWGIKHKKKISLTLPIAHHDGRFFGDPLLIGDLKNSDRIALTYEAKDDRGDALVNGSKLCIAGILGGVQNNVVGLMPHPERAVLKQILGEDGLVILDEFLFG